MPPSDTGAVGHDVALDDLRGVVRERLVESRAHLRRVLDGLDMQTAALAAARETAEGTLRWRRTVLESAGAVIVRELEAQRELRRQGAPGMGRDLWVGTLAYAAGVARDLLRDGTEAVGHALEGNVGRGAAALALALSRRGIAHLPAVQRQLEGLLQDVERQLDEIRGITIETARLDAAVQADRVWATAQLVEVEATLSAVPRADALTLGRARALDSDVQRGLGARVAGGVARRRAAALLSRHGRATPEGDAYLTRLRTAGSEARMAEEAERDARRRARDFGLSDHGPTPLEMPRAADAAAAPPTATIAEAPGDGAAVSGGAQTGSGAESVAGSGASDGTSADLRVGEGSVPDEGGDGQARERARRVAAARWRAKATRALGRGSAGETPSASRGAADPSDGRDAPESGQARASDPPATVTDGPTRSGRIPPGVPGSDAIRPTSTSGGRGRGGPGG